MMQNALTAVELKRPDKGGKKKKGGDGENEREARAASTPTLLRTKDRFEY